MQYIKLVLNEPIILIPKIGIFTTTNKVGLILKTINQFGIELSRYIIRTNNDIIFQYSITGALTNK